LQGGISLFFNTTNIRNIIIASTFRLQEPVRPISRNPGLSTKKGIVAPFLSSLKDKWLPARQFTMSKTILCFSLILILVPSLSRSQSVSGMFEGTVLSPNGSPLPYVSIGIVNKPIGTMSNNQGEFTLDLGHASPTDTLKLSLVGYAPLEFLISDLSNDTIQQVFHLTPRAITLTEVQVIGKKEVKEMTIGRKARGGILQATFNPSKTRIQDKLGTEIGMKMGYSEKSPGVLKAFH
jgi:hypothetical protein